MPDTYAPVTPRAAHPALPLQGLTMLAVDDSRFASEALRLVCQRSGARLRRAETIEAALRHLSVYRPDVVIVDLGLPDGDGADLIRTLAQARNGPVVLATSGDPANADVARDAGAAGFVAKPPEGLAAFQRLVLSHLIGGMAAPPDPAEPPLHPDRLALRDDLAHAAALLSRAADARTRRYVAGFLGSLAQSTRDTILARAADRAAAQETALAHLSELVSDRLATAPAPFTRGRELPPPGAAKPA